MDRAIAQPFRCSRLTFALGALIPRFASTLPGMDANIVTPAALARPSCGFSSWRFDDAAGRPQPPAPSTFRAPVPKGRRRHTGRVLSLIFVACVPCPSVCAAHAVADGTPSASLRLLVSFREPYSPGTAGTICAVTADSAV
ncbi:hypothetical protein CERSUDRAFT_101393 [Gelatoporia subvermispora B]|uniref:Uncharacterized protein n=1 Tax=Ceriporiopsis subvermispora (strain B) TaxID=914234 RepID=M2QWY1_CERS8|nr:hypothetical protein CERSUDRAFT_101393 [Gelatoporia subvermispora B]